METLNETSTLPAVATAIRGWFPELKGRAFAVSDSQITKENLPTLPLCQVALLRETGNHSVRSKSMEPDDSFVIEFWFTPERIKDSKDRETPFWAFYDYTKLRNKLMGHLMDWVSPEQAKVQYDYLDIEATSFAVVITFYMRHQFTWCEPEIVEDACDPQLPQDGQPARITYALHPPASVFCGPAVPETEEENPCP